MFDSDDDLLNHRRQLMGCNVGSPRPLEGLTKEQKELLRPRDRNKSEEERWNTVYRICFPDDDTIPSPCMSILNIYAISQANSQRLRLLF